MTRRRRGRAFTRREEYLSRRRDWNLALLNDRISFRGWIDGEYENGRLIYPRCKHVKHASRSGQARFVKRQSAKRVRQVGDLPMRGNCYKLF